MIFRNAQALIKQQIHLIYLFLKTLLLEALKANRCDYVRVLLAKGVEFKIHDLPELYRLVCAFYFHFFYIFLFIVKRLGIACTFWPWLFFLDCCVSGMWEWRMLAYALDFKGEYVAILLRICQLRWNAKQKFYFMDR